ncbi:MAG: hypothetical protein ACYTHM_06115 [Planctomycetota bacterium]|jgi:hypothetical protein
MHVVVLFIFVLMISLVAGAYIQITLIRLSYDERGWHDFLFYFDRLADNRFTRPLFSRLLGKRLARKTIERYVRMGNFRKAGDQASAEGLADETIDLLEEREDTLEAARLAMRTGNEDRTTSLYRNAIDTFLKEGRDVLAAEAAEEAGFTREAVRLFRSLGSREGRLHAARLAKEHGETELAVEIFLEEGDPLSAMHAAQEAGEVDFVISYCRDSDDPILHHFGAETARKAGQPEIGIDLLLSRGHLHQAAQFAQAAGLGERAKELFKEIAQSKQSIHRLGYKSG